MLNIGKLVRIHCADSKWMIHAKFSPTCAQAIDSSRRDEAESRRKTRIKSDDKQFAIRYGNVGTKANRKNLVRPQPICIAIIDIVVIAFLQPKALAQVDERSF